MNIKTTMTGTSNCCNSSVRVEGNTTRYYVCNKCNLSCDRKYEKN